MATSSRKTSNGRSPLVNPQRQITSFFEKKTSSSGFSSVVAWEDSSRKELSPGSNPTTPSPVSANLKKSVLVVGVTPTSAGKHSSTTNGDDAVGKRIRVFWPLDNAWYDGCVISYNESKGKHRVKYDDGDEEELALDSEKIEWVEERKLKRLRRGSLGLDHTAQEDIQKVDSEMLSDEGQSSDQSWDGNDVSSDDGDNGEIEVEEKIGNEIETGKFKQEGKHQLGKRKAVAGGKNMVSVKKIKSSNDEKNGGFKLPEVSISVKNTDSDPCSNLEKPQIMDTVERFSMRDAEKFPFLGIKRRDANRKLPGDPSYDPKTLYLPPEFIKSLSSGQRQWWEFKSKHMDKVLFFKMGKFYELFEMDAHVGARELNLQYMKGEQPHCGFPEKNFSLNVENLARKGYRVLVVEQTETPEQMEIRRKEKGCKDKVVNREICAVVTKGTLTEGALLSEHPDPSYLMAVAERTYTNLQIFKRTFGVSIIDATTSRVILGQFEDDEKCSLFCSLLSEMRPVEIIQAKQSLSTEAERALLKHTRNPLINELIPIHEFWDAEKTVREVKGLYKQLDQSNSEENMGLDVLLDLYQKGENGNLAVSALGGALYYLRQAFLDETLLRFAKFELLPDQIIRDITNKPYMILDAPALENLEIFENSRNGDSNGSLYAQINHCATAFGKRLLRTWLTRPLYEVKSIVDRQDAISCLAGSNKSATLEFRNLLVGLPDMERLLVRIFSSSNSNGRNANKVVLYEDAAKKQLKDFISGLQGFDLMDSACSSLGLILEYVDSSILHHLLTPGNGRPDVKTVLTYFKDAFDWVEANGTGRIVPHQGVDKEYDSACQEVERVVDSLQKHIKKQRKLLGDSSICYVTIGKEAYLLEVPEHLRGSIPEDYELRSSRKGFYRYWNPAIKKYLGELATAESEKDATLKSILHRLIGKFCEYHEKWRQLISVIAELDVLISLSIASEFYEGSSCRPNIIDSQSSNQVPCLSAKCLGHPILGSDLLGKGSFVPNDISIGDTSSSFIVLTGPNMGGKSTLLRQVCLAVILAQVGANVPAECFVLSPVDRIFVRMGAKDHIMSGQSTFLTELSETAMMLSSATRKSLVALDELGRGTSTSDGQAIASAVLEHLIHKVQCRGLFSTHYHHLAMQYESNPKVSLCHMACQVDNDAQGIEQVTFLYRLTPSACPKSYGVNVARLAGIPDCVLRRAAEKSCQFEILYGNQRAAGTETLSASKNYRRELTAILATVNRLCSENSCGISFQGNIITSLMELQHRVRSLIGG